jgi:NADP-dependent 3-hydroxy acid dehydrogenase YdfG
MLKAKVALVTGGGSGIGKAIATQLAKIGVSVAIASRSQSRVDTVASELTAAGLSALAVQMDVRDKTKRPTRHRGYRNQMGRNSYSGKQCRHLRA